MKDKRKFSDNGFRNILRLFDVLTNFTCITNETMRNYYELPHELPNDLKF